MEQVNQRKVTRRMNWRLLVNTISKYIFLLATLFGLARAFILIYRVVSEGLVGLISISSQENYLHGLNAQALWVQF